MGHKASGPKGKGSGGRGAAKVEHKVAERHRARKRRCESSGNVVPAKSGKCKRSVFYIGCCQTHCRYCRRLARVVA